MEISWNSTMVVLSILVAIFGSYTALAHIQRMRLSTGRASYIWMLAGGVSFGISIWSMHFIGMLAMHFAVPISFDSRITFISVLPAVITALFGFYQLRAIKPSFFRIMSSGLIMGLGIVIMHYLGLHAMQVTPSIKFDPLVFLVSVAIAGLAAFGIPYVVYAGEKLHLNSMVYNGLGGIAIGLALAAMHYTGMASAQISAGSYWAVGAGEMDPNVLALFVALGVFVLLAGGVVAGLFDQNMTQYTLQNMNKLQQAHIVAMSMAGELQQVLHSVSQGVVVTDVNQKITYVNEAFEKITGYSESETLSKSLDFILGSGREPDLIAEILVAIDKNESFHADILCYKKNGDSFWNELSFNAVRNSHGETIRFVGVLRDVTERRNNEQEIKEFKATLDQTLDCVFMFDAKTLNFLYVNRGAIEQVGYSAEEMAQLRPYDIQPDINEEEFYRLIYPLQSGNQIVLNFETVYQHKNGNRIPVEVSLQLVSVPGTNSRFVAVVHDITERKRIEKELSLHRDHLQELVEDRTKELRSSEASAHLALSALQQQKFILDQHAIVAITDLSGAINYANDKFCAISGYPREELLGQNHRMLNSGHHPKKFFKQMYKTIGSGHVWHGEICNCNKNGSLYWVDTTIAPFKGSDGNVFEYIAIRTDITERKHAEELANSANRAKGEFLANMSHEIRTPMNGVVGMLDILLESPLSHEQQYRLETVRKSALGLLSILNDILDFSKIEAGKLSIENIPVDIRDVVEGAAQILPAVVSSNNIDFHVFISPEIPPILMSDPLRLRQILFNLLGNALKFSSKTEGRKSQVVLRVKKSVMDDGRACLCMRITDNGIGMMPDTLANLFQNFTQADDGTTRRFGGTGLGLSITKKLTEMMGGEIQVSSIFGEGSEFKVGLPLQEADFDSMNTVANIPDLTGVKVLLVSASPLYVEFVPIYLRSAGAEVVVAKNSKAAGYGADYDVVILDSDNAHTSSQFDKGHIVQLFRGSSSLVNSSVVSVSTCPMMYAELLQSVGIASGKMSAQEVARMGKHSSESRNASLRFGDGQLILLAEDNETNREVITEQLHLLGYTSEVAVDGSDALEKWRNGNYALLLTDCHMPNMDGFQLTTAIREEQAEGGRLKIIAVTANAMQGEAQRCLACGMDDYLSKPIRLNELGAMLAKWLPSQTTNVMESNDEAQELIAQPIEPAKSEESALIWDAGKLSQLVGDNAEMHKRVLERFLVNAEEQVAMINMAVVNNNANVVIQIAHKLKSSARTVGAMQFGQLCYQLEVSSQASDSLTVSRLVSELGPAFNSVSVQILEHFSKAEDLIS